MSFNPYSSGSHSGSQGHFGHACCPTRGFNPYSIGSHSRSSVLSDGLRGAYLFQSVFYRKSFKKVELGVTGLLESVSFNPYSIGSHSRSGMVQHGFWTLHEFQSVFYRKSFKKFASQILESEDINQEMFQSVFYRKSFKKP